MKRFRAWMHLGILMLVVLPASPAFAADGPPAVAVTLDPPIVGIGAASTLRWTATGASSCVASGHWSGPQPTSGQRVVSQSDAGNFPYTLTCSNGHGSGRDSVLLQVSAFAQAAARPQFLYYQDWPIVDPDALPVPFTGVAWGWYPPASGPADTFFAEVARWKARQGLYLPASSMIRDYRTIPAPAAWDAFRIRTLDGSYAPATFSAGFPTYSISSPEFRDFLKAQAMTAVDAGADGMHVDDVAGQFNFIVSGPPDQAGSFDPVTMAAFRTYLQATHSTQQLRERFNIPNVDSFDYGSYIGANGLSGTWNRKPLTGLAREFYLFRRQESIAFLRDLASSAKAYAKSRYGRNFVVSGNINVCPCGYGVLDALDLLTPEFFYVRGMGTPFGAIHVKAYQGWRVPTFVLPEAMPPSLGVANPLLKATANLARVITADIQAAGGTPGETLQMNSGLGNPQPVDQDVVRRYANFVLANGSLLAGAGTHARTALLHSAPSMLGNLLESPGEANPESGPQNYYGTAQLLLDGGITYDSIFLPDTSHSTLPALTVDRFSPYDVVIAPSVWAIDDAQLSVLLDFAQRGGTLVIDGSFATSNPDATAALRPAIASLIASAGEQGYGSGRIVVSKATHGARYIGAGNDRQRSTRAAFLAFLTPYVRPDVAIVQPPATIHEPGVTPFFHRAASGDALVHLVNYDYDDATDQFHAKTNLAVTVDVGAQIVDEVVARSPDQAGAAVLPFVRNGSEVTVSVPRVEAWVLLNFQRNASAPVITGSTPPAVVGAVGGATIDFAVDAEDADANPLTYVWSVNGRQVTDAFGPDYTLTTPAAGGGPYTVVVAVADGSHVVQRQWTVDTVPYRPPRVLFDETHAERNTIDAARASQLDPAHPERVRFGVLRQALAPRYDVARLASGPITAQVLGTADVLVLAAPTSALSWAELQAIRAFVHGGGGLVYLGDAGATGSINTLTRPLGVVFDGNGRIRSPQDATSPDSFALGGFATHPALGRNPSYQANSGGRLLLSNGVAGLGTTTAAEWWSTTSQPTQQPGEADGPFAMIAALTYGDGRIYVLSDNAFHDSHLQSVTGGGNLGLFQSALEWLTVNVNAPPFNNAQGLWWAAPAGAESGWGINFAHQGDIVFGTWFTYDAAGKPWWLIAQLEKVASGVYTGPVSTVSGPRFNASPFGPAPVGSQVGTMTATFSNASRGTIAYAVNGTAQSKTIVPREFGTLPTCVWGAQRDLTTATNYTDLWWNAGEPGWGINFAHRGDTILATWFTYDETGKPWWLIAELHKGAANVYSGVLSTVSGAPFLGVAFDASKVSETPVGTATVTFANGNAATFAYTVRGLAASKAITRQVFVPPGTVCH